MHFCVFTVADCLLHDVRMLSRVQRSDDWVLNESNLLAVSTPASFDYFVSFSIRSLPFVCVVLCFVYGARSVGKKSMSV